MTGSHTTPRQRSDYVALILLPFGGFVFLVGWFAGVYLLWISKSWTTKEKLLATFVVPGGYLTLMLLSIAISGPADSCSELEADGRCPGDPSPFVEGLLVAAMIAVYIAPLAIVLWLAVLMQRRTGRQRESSSTT